MNHAPRFTVRHTKRGFIHPASHLASSSTDANLPPMGLRFRMKASATPKWNGDAPGDLKSIPGSAFEAIDTGPIIR